MNSTQKIIIKNRFHIPYRKNKKFEQAIQQFTGAK